MSKKLTIDGNTAAAHVAYAFSDVAAIYPITPSSPMAEFCDEWAAAGRKNIFGQTMKISEMQSEAGAAGAVHGALVSGALTTTFTASQGLLLMIPNMYKISGELLPCVFHVTARAISTQALSIYGDHSDVMACRQTGFAMLCSGSVQEVMDLSLVSHLATLKAKVPFLNFFDGFRTSHEVSKIDVFDYEEIAKMVDWDEIKAFRERALNPEHPHQQGTAQNPDFYFQNREAANKFYDATPETVQSIMDEVYKACGRKYNLFDYVGAKDAEHVIVIMGSGGEAIEETINYLNKKGAKLGVLKVRLYRPFSIKHFIDKIPASVKMLCVLDRTKEPGSIGEPLYQDVINALFESGKTNVKVIGGRYGLSSREFTPSMIKAVFDNMDAKEPKNHFTIGITDDVTHTSLEVKDIIDSSPEGLKSCKFYGLGSDGTVGANKNSIKIIGDHTDMYAQGFFFYDSKKSGGVTMSLLRFGKTPIQSTYMAGALDFVACHNSSYVTRYEILDGVKEGGVFLLNSSWTAEEMEKQLPASIKNEIAKKKLKFYNIDAIKLASEIGLGGKINMVMQAAFFKVADIIAVDDAFKYMKEAVKKTYGKKGDKIVNMNNTAIDRASAELVQINYPASWADTKEGADPVKIPASDYFDNFVLPSLRFKGDDLPVSAFDPRGFVPTGTSQYEKRGIAVNVPDWIPENCIMCNQCSYVCPHACIRPFLAKEEDLKNAPKEYIIKNARGKEIEGYKFRIQLSPLDCTGCGNCADICPAKDKALEMVPMNDILNRENDNWNFAIKLKRPEAEIKKNTVIGSQFAQPLFEFSGACGGCGETPYIKLVTQLFGERMMVANATGCSSIYGGNSPTCPYTKNPEGKGPAWASSLFEDNAEFGFGMNLGVVQRRSNLKDKVSKALEMKLDDGIKDALATWFATFNDAEGSKAASKTLKEMLPGAIKAASGDVKKALIEIFEDSDMFVKKSIWIFGGDGWAYDIGYGGLDHVLAMGEDVNILVLDTELYSNTGGQSSKATPTGSTAKFATAGKRTKKKDLGMIAMSYGYVYVASVCMGANQNQLLKAVLEAESYKGPSLIIAYAPCINQGLNMGKAQHEQKRAVEAGYWLLYRYNPLLKAEGKNPLTLDSKEPTADYKEFIMGETRYAALAKQFPNIAEELFDKAAQEAKERYLTYKKMSEQA